jgi:uncharacterized protein (TIGR03792 family)
MEPSMVIEYLKVEVPITLRERYIQTDAEIWTPILASYPGFVRKEVWINPRKETELVMVIHWQTKEAWKAIPVDVLQETDRRFVEAMGQAFAFTEEGEWWSLRSEERC